MNILKTGVLTAVATFFKLLSGFIVIKLVAVLAGPEGVAQLGQFMSLTALLVVFAGGGIGPGVVKYIAEYSGDLDKLQALLRSALSFTLAASLVMCICVLLLSKEITLWLLGDIQYRGLIVVLAFAQIFVALHNLFVAVINGTMDVKRLAAVHVCGAVIGVLAPCILGYYFKLYGVLFAYVLSQAALVVISFIFYKRSNYFKWSYFKLDIDKLYYQNLARFSLMTLTSALLAPVIQITVRNVLANKFSWEQVGYWQAVSKVSEAYLLFITMAISVYYLPKLSAITDKVSLKREIMGGYKVLLPVVICASIVIYMLRDVITLLLFSEEFYAARYLYAPQLLGDVIKVASFVLSYVMIAKAMMRTFLLSELCFGAMYVGWVVVLTDAYGLVGSMYAFVVNYFLYFIFTMTVTKIYLRSLK